MKESTSPSESTATSPSESTAQAQATLTELVLEDNELTDEALAGVSGGRASVKKPDLPDDRLKRRR